MADAKSRGNAAFSAKDYNTAIREYTSAISSGPTAALYSNRSASYALLNNFEKALEDAEMCVKLDAAWPKGYNRKAFALYSLERHEEAKQVCEAGLKLAPNDASIKEVLDNVNKAMSNPLGKMFGPSMWGKLAADPSTAPLLADPNFVNKMKMLQSNPQMLNNMLTDPQCSMALGVILGMGSGAFRGAGSGAAGTGEDDDFDAAPSTAASSAKKAEAKSSGPSKAEMEAREREMEAHRARARADAAAAEKKRVEDEKKRAEEAKEKARRELEEEKRREEEEELANMTPEERQVIANKKLALEAKDRGNAFYTKKNPTKEDLVNAMREYDAAVTLDPTNPTFLLNIAAVQVAQKEFDLGITSLNQALQVAKDNKHTDFKFIAKVWQRIGNAQMAKKEFGLAVQAYDNSLLEDATNECSELRRKANAKWVEKKKADYLDPQKALEAKERGNKLYAEGKFPQAKAEYDEAIARDPNNHIFYSNRANCLAKLMTFASALEDCERCIKLKPEFAKIYIRKAKIQHFLKQYSKALETYDIGLALDPHSSELIEGKRETQIKIAQENQSGNVDPERQRQAMQDPEIQAILRDPVINNVLQDLQDAKGSERAQEALRTNPDIASKINKLIAAGVLRTA